MFEPSQCGVRRDEHEQTSVNHRRSSTYSERSSLLDVDAHAKLEILKLSKFSGSGKFLNQSSSVHTEESHSYVHTVEGDMERINFIKGHQNETIKNVRATHIVTGIRYGGRIILDMKSKKDFSSRREATSKSGEVGIGYGPLGISGVGRVTKNEQATDENTELTFDYYGDAVLESKPPKTLNGVKQFELTKEVINRLKKSQLKVWLYPLDGLLGKDVGRGRCQAINDQIASDAEKYCQSLVDYLSVMRALKEHRCWSVINVDFTTQVDVALNSYRYLLRRLLPQVRACAAEEQELTDELRKYTADYSPFSLSALDTFVDNLEVLSAQLDGYLGKVERFGGEYFRKRSDVTARVFANMRGGKKTLVVYLPKLKRAFDEQESLLNQYGSKLSQAATNVGISVPHSDKSWEYLSLDNNDKYKGVIKTIQAVAEHAEQNGGGSKFRTVIGTHNQGDMNVQMFIDDDSEVRFVIPVLPERIEVESVDHRSVTVKMSSAVSGTVKHVHVRTKREEDAEWVTETFEPDVVRVKIKGLLPSENYEFAIRAETPLHTFVEQVGFLAFRTQDAPLRVKSTRR
eukprot:GHVU01119089.1.p1 GENE.GHVU01119089.1~~GHVU01119089.1.p1  ORF type:complete len:628 (+),score=66.12 GHVU01119089.1:169-1884(+)